MLGSLILYLKGMRIMMFQLSGFYCRASLLELWILDRRIWEFPKIRGTLFWCPFNTDPTIYIGSILGSPRFGNPHFSDPTYALLSRGFSA